MKIAIGNDHTAIELKNIIREFVEGKARYVKALDTMGPGIPLLRP